MKYKILYYILSFTWGLPMTLLGVFVALGLLIIGYKPKRYGGCWHFEVGKGWGGLNIGLIIITSQNPSDHTLAHEHGHSVQNCCLGPVMPFLVAIPSATRYWYREWLVRSGRKKYAELPDYYSVWYEGTATILGNKVINLWQ